MNKHRIIENISSMLSDLSTVKLKINHKRNITNNSTLYNTFWLLSWPEKNMQNEIKQFKGPNGNRPEYKLREKMKHVLERKSLWILRKTGQAQKNNLIIHAKNLEEWSTGKNCFPQESYKCWEKQLDMPCNPEAFHWRLFAGSQHGKEKQLQVPEWLLPSEES